MDIPHDIWEYILMMINKKEECDKLYYALPYSTQKLLEPSYDMKLDEFKDIYLVFFQSVLIIFKNDNIYCIKDFILKIKDAQFSYFKREVVIILEDNDIFYYDYEKDVSFIFGINKNILKNNTIFLYQNYQKDKTFIVSGNRNGLFYHLNPEEIQKSLYSTDKPGKKKFIFEINDNKPEFASFVYHQYDGIGHYEMKLVNYLTDEIIYKNNGMKITCIFFDENGKLFFSSDNEICSLDENNKKEVFYYNNSYYKIDQILRYQDYVYYASYCKIEEVTNIIALNYCDINCNLCEYLLFELRNRVKYLHIHKNYLVVGTNKDLYFFDLYTRKIKRNINLSYLIENSNILELIDLDKNVDLRFDLILK